jgi:D-ribose pyranase
LKEVGILNRDISDILTRAGHQDEICICDAGFAMPTEVKSVDISLKDNCPKLIDVLEEIKKYFSIEKIIIADVTKTHNPTMFKNIVDTFKNKVELEIISHEEFKVRSKRVKGIIRTGEFTAYSNVILVSGAKRERWFIEKDSNIE